MDCEISCKNVLQLIKGNAYCNNDIAKKYARGQTELLDDIISAVN